MENQIKTNMVHEMDTRIILGFTQRGDSGLSGTVEGLGSHHCPNIVYILVCRALKVVQGSFHSKHLLNKREV